MKHCFLFGGALYPVLGSDWDWKETQKKNLRKVEGKVSNGTRETIITTPLHLFPKGAAGLAHARPPLFFGRLLFCLFFLPFTHWPYSDTMTNWVSDDRETGGSRV